MTILYVLPMILALIHILWKRNWSLSQIGKTFLAYLLFFNIGLLSLLAAYGHIFMGPEIAKEIGWPPGSPFQYEVGVANLSYGILGVLSFWIKDRFWDATVLGWSLFVLGAFVGHMVQMQTTGNVAPYNFGFFVWFNDLFLPLFALSLLLLNRKTIKKVSTK